MKPIKSFEEFIQKGVVKKQSLNKSRADFLVKQAKQDYEYLLELIKKIPIKDSNANNYIKNCYDILMGLVRAKMLLDGYNASGFGAHEAEISYLGFLGFKEKEILFADKLRFFRNGILYYGTILDKEYAEKTIEFTKKSLQKLTKVLNSN